MNSTAETQRSQRTQLLCGLHFAAVWIFLFWLTPGLCAQVSDLKPNQKLIFFPSTGHRINSGKTWEITVHGLVYKPKDRRVALALLREGLELKHVQMSEAEEIILSERARLFMEDDEGHKRIVVLFGDQRFALSRTGPDGQFFGTIRLADETVRRAASFASNCPARLRFEAVLPQADMRVFDGFVWLVEDSGLTVISDIDDSIKITEVRDHHAMLRNTFLNPFRPVAGMADLYRDWAAKYSAQFCYVSASPWQLFSPLDDFIQTNRFPAGVFALKDFRFRNRSFFSLFESPEKYKLTTIRPMLELFPERRFILVGDSGERDPEAYGELTREHPGQIEHIYIRDVTREPATASRYSKAFHDLPETVWQVFEDPAGITR